MDDRKRIMLLDLGSTTTTGSGRRAPAAEKSKARAERGVHADLQAVSCCPSTDGSHAEDPAG